jgi:hypothetical protein
LTAPTVTVCRLEEPPCAPAKIVISVASLLAPLVPLVLLWAINLTPVEVESQSLRLTGEWKVLPSEAEGLGDPGVDDTAWKTIELPTNFAVAGFRKRTTGFGAPSSCRRPPSRSSSCWAIRTTPW